MRAPPTERAALPVFRDGFVGRARELATVARAFEAGARLVTLVGPPGAGKTRLAFEHASRAARSVFCDLTDARSIESAAAALAAAIGAHLGDVAAVHDVVGDLARALERLEGGMVVLDNLEQVVVEAAPLVGALLDATTATRFLCTSREALRIAGEQQVQVGSLDEDDAVALYDARARAVDAAHVGGGPPERELVRRLDALPLAIELAAARAHLVPAQRMIAELERPLDALRSPRRDARPMHASLRRAIEASWALLAEHERTALAECGVFRGGFDVEAADAVVTAPPPGHAGREAAFALVERSLLRVIDRREGVRLAAYDAVGAFARERLDERGGRPAVARRHAEHFVHAGERGVRAPYSGASVATLRWLSTERENLMEAHRAMREVDPALSARAALVLAPSLRTRGPRRLWEGLVAGAIDAATQSPDRVLEARARVAHAELLTVAGDLAASDREATRALSLATGDHARAVQAVASGVRATVAWLSGDVGAYDRLAAETLSLARGEEPGVEAWALGFRTGPLLVQRRYAEARPLVDRALRLASDLGDDILAVTLLAYAGVLASYEARFDDAAVVLARAIDLCRQMQFRRREGELLHYLAQAARDAGALADARRHYHDALDALADAGYASFAHGTALELAALEHELGEDAAAEGRVRETLSSIAARGAGDRLHGLGHAYLAALLPDGPEHDEERERHRAAARGLAASTGDSNVRQAVELLDGVVEARRARRAAAEGRGAEAAQSSALARGRLRAAAGAIEEAHAAGRVLARALASLPEAAAAAEARLRVGPDARWFELDRRREDLGRRGPPRRLLLALAERRLERPGEALTASELIGLGWPGERMRPEAASMRLYTTIRLLRRLGLQDLLITRDDGYLLDPSAGVAVES